MRFWCRVCLPLMLLGAFALAAIAQEQSEENHSLLATYDALIKPADREHWSYQAVVRPGVPEVHDGGWVRNPIDRFVLAKLEARGWRPSEAAPAAAVLRRVYLDLIGIPPTLEEQHAFLADPSQERLDVTVEDLLSRAGYGERWGRHWLDLVRFAETNGYERDATKPHAWRYRDYVIRAFNDDKPFDRFILEQLAGDELPGADAETMIATGYYRLGPWDDEPADPQQDRFDQLDDMVRTTSQVFLGLTMGCARCHNHKFDPLTMHDYYRMVAIFNPLQRPRNGRTELDRPAGSAAQLAAAAQRDRTIGAADNEIAALRARTRDALVESGKSGLPDEVVAALGVEPDKRTDVEKALVEKHSEQLAAQVEAALPEEAKARIAALSKQIAEMRSAVPDLPRGYFMHEPSTAAPATHLLLRGRAGSPGPEVQPGVPAVLVSQQPSFPEPGQRSSRRRLLLAQWIATEDHPLTARVIVNRVWQHHFGEGLVRTPSDFGTLGQRPTHPQLLDWLAHWFVHDAGWSIKRLHRLIMASNTYRMSKRRNGPYDAADPENLLLWRVPYRRLDVEAIRDSMLAVSGRLNRKMYGPSMYPAVPAAALEGHSDPGKIWRPFDEEEASRRTIYAFVKRSMIVPMMEVMDFCDTTQSAERRVVTSVAPQALTLFNGDFVNRQSRHLAARLVQEAGPDPGAQIERAYRLSLCRKPTTEESSALVAFLQREAEQLSGESAAGEEPIGQQEAHRKALEQVCRVIFNLSEFAYSD